MGLAAPGEVSGSCGDTAACAATILSQTGEQESPSGSREERRVVGPGQDCTWVIVTEEEAAVSLQTPQQG